jgi:3-isopropylmalate/(R)-2-methylmalate dehydratase small subunit
MKALRVHRGQVAPLLRRDIDTDQIIPKQFLKSIERTGFGRHLFNDWRFGPGGQLKAGFVLNDERYRGATVLVTGPNFGCGSSREHAAWALEDYGFRVVIAPSFADIFRNNAITNGVLPVVLPEAVVNEIATRASGATPYEVEVDLESRRVRDEAGLDVSFDLDDASRHRLLNGLDDIGLILEHQEAISRYERRLQAVSRQPSAVSDFSDRGSQMAEG